MTDQFRTPGIAIGDLEREVLEALWEQGPMNPGQMHEAVGLARGISVNTVSSALKRLFEKELLDREKVSHSYVYRAVVSRAELQRLLIDAIATQFEQEGNRGLLSAFVELADARGEETLRQLEQMIAARLAADSEEAP